MAYCGVWTLHDHRGDPLHSVRYAWLPGEEERDVMEDALSQDVRELLRKRPDLGVVTLADGAPEMQGFLDRVVDGVPVAARIVDFYHLTEKLAAASRALKRDVKADAARFVPALLARDEAIDEIAEEVAAWAVPFYDGVLELPEPLHAALTYMDNQRERLRYASARKSNLPIGSGHVEATCKTIVAVRFKRAGARWVPEGAAPLLHLRALATSSRWDAAMALLLKAQQREFREAA